ncbi:MAG: nitrate reductase associated protein [Vulcanococcus sp.]
MPAPSTPQAQHCFGFELDFVGSWRCIPLCVRRKLDLIGLKLKLNHWLALSQPQRQELVDWPDTPQALQGLKQHLLDCTATMADGQARLLPPAQGEPWQLDGCVPSHVVQAAQERGMALSPASWSQLSELGRFALCKLARPGHDHHNLDAALEELLPAGHSVTTATGGGARGVVS